MGCMDTSKSIRVGCGRCCICGTDLKRRNAITCSNRCRTELCRARNGGSSRYKVTVDGDGTESVVRPPERRPTTRDMDHDLLELTNTARRLERLATRFAQRYATIPAKRKSDLMEAHRSDVERLEQTIGSVCDTLHTLE